MNVKYNATPTEQIESLAPKNVTTLILSLFDLVSGEHGPLFQAVSLPLAWRSVEKLFASGEMPKSDVILVCHGTFNHNSLDGAINAFNPAVIYDCTSKLELDSTNDRVQNYHSRS